MRTVDRSRTTLDDGIRFQRDCNVYTLCYDGRLLASGEFLEFGYFQCDVDTRLEHLLSALQLVGLVTLVTVNVQPHLKKQPRKCVHFKYHKQASFGRFFQLIGHPYFCYYASKIAYFIVLTYFMDLKTSETIFCKYHC